MSDDKQIKIRGERDMPMNAMSLGMMSWNKTGSWRNLRPVIDYEKCTGCMLCWKFCPDACIGIENEKPKVDYDYCKGCLVCVEECPVNAIDVEKEE
jgi:2-oxoacid:acceptor oxidoreductase delta subunit (pyruvate/2-ketoisovalerate family)